MSWFNTSGISSLAKSAISQAQKSIDKVLDIKDENEGATASDRNTNIKKSKSYTEGYSRSHQRLKFDKEDGDDNEKSDLKKGKRMIPEEDSFFSSFLGSDKHSTPKLNSETNSKLTFQSAPVAEKSDRVNRKPKLKTERSSRSLSKGSIESISKESVEYDVPESSREEVEVADLKECTRNDAKESINDDMLGEFSKKNDPTNSMGAKAGTKNSVERDMHEKGEKSLVSQFLMESNTSINRVDIVKTELAEQESISKNDDITPKTITSNKVANELNNLVLEDGSDSIDDGNDDENDEHVVASSRMEADNSKGCEKNNEKHDDADRDALLKFEGENTRADSIDNSSSMISVTQHISLGTCGEKSYIENFDIQNLEDQSDVDSREANEDQDTLNSEIRESESVDSEKDRNEKSKVEENSSLLSNKGTCEANSKLDSVEDCDSIESEKELDVTKDLFPTDIEDGVKKEENEFSIKIDSADGQLGGPHENNFRNRIDDIQNDGKAESINDLNNMPNQQIESDLEIIRNTESPTDLTAKPEDVKGDVYMSCVETVELQKEIKRLQEVVDARESRMVALSKENIDLQEGVSILRSQLEQAQLVESSDNEVIREMRDEFTNIVDEMRIELKTVKKERDTLKIDLEETMERLTKNSEDLIEDYTRSIKEKEEQIAELLEEGEALSKKELKSNNMLKKFRAKVKTLEEKLEQIKKQSDEKDAEITKLKETVKEKNELEKALREKVKTLELITDQQEDENSKLKDQLDDAEDKIKGMETTLDSGYQEINRLNLEKANIESEIEEIKHLKTTKAEFEQRVLEVEEQAKHEKLANLEELNNLRLCLTRTEQMAARREDNFQMEIKDLQHRLDGAESRNQELSQSIATASRPLLRQIENLQSSHQNQAQNWERIEKNLTERLATAQQQLTHVTEKERSAVDFAMEMKSRVSGLELQIKTLREQKDEITGNMEELEECSKIIKENLNRERKSFETYQSNYRKAFEELQNEKMYIEDQLNTERAKHAAELLRIANEHKATAQLSRQNSSNAIQSSSVDGRTEPGEAEPDEPRSFTRPRTSSSSSSSNIFESLNKHTSTAIMEKLQTQLKQKDGELRIHKEEIDSLQKTRASLAQELVSLSNLVEELQGQMNGYDSMKKKYQDMESRYNAALQLYGEKVEEADELRMDLEDIKQMYKQQIQQLIGDR